MNDMLEGMFLVHSEVRLAFERMTDSLTTVIDIETANNPESGQIEKLLFAQQTMFAFWDDFSANYDIALRITKQGESNAD